MKSSAWWRKLQEFKSHSKKKQNQEEAICQSALSRNREPQGRSKTSKPPTQKRVMKFSTNFFSKEVKKPPNNLMLNLKRNYSWVTISTMIWETSSTISIWRSHQVLEEGLTHRRFIGHMISRARTKANRVNSFILLKSKNLWAGSSEETHCLDFSSRRNMLKRHFMRQNKPVMSLNLALTTLSLNLSQKLSCINLQKHKFSITIA